MKIMRNQFILKLFGSGKTVGGQLFLSMQIVFVLFLFCSSNVMAAVHSGVDRDTFQQERITYKGSVKDDSGEPVIGATVKIRDKSEGTVTDVKGSFTILANSGDVLVVSFIGYNTVEVVTGVNR